MYKQIGYPLGNNIVFLPFTKMTDISVKISENDRNNGHFTKFCLGNLLYAIAYNFI